MSDLDKELDAILAGNAPKSFEVTIEDAPAAAITIEPAATIEPAVTTEPTPPPAPPAVTTELAPPAPPAPSTKRQRRTAEPAAAEAAEKVDEKVDELADIRSEFPDLPDYVLAELAAGRARLRSHAARVQEEPAEEV